MKKYLTLLLFLFSLFPTHQALAQTMVDQRCFPRADCITAREGLETTTGIIGTPAEGFYTGTETSICPSHMFTQAGEDGGPGGFCSPAGQASLSIKIGGQKEFPDIAQYIAYIYRYSMIVGMVLATLMVIVAGIQWMLSGGDSSKIEGAKKRISGAIIGLLLLATSYTILNTINPALVNLRLPQTWMIRGIDQFNPDCSNITVPLGLARTQGSSIFEPMPTATTSWNFSSLDARCGSDYYISTGAGQTCQGSACPDNNNLPLATDQMCLPITINGTIVTNTPKCRQNTKFVIYLKPSFTLNFVNSVVGGGLAAYMVDILESNWIDIEAMRLYAVCKPGTRVPLGQDQFGYSPRLIMKNNNNMIAESAARRIEPSNTGDVAPYIIMLSGEAIRSNLSEKCGDESQIAGFVFMTEIAQGKSLDDSNLFISPTISSGGTQRITGRAGSVADIVVERSSKTENTNNWLVHVDNDSITTDEGSGGYLLRSDFAYFNYEQIINGNGIFATVDLNWETVSNLLNDNNIYQNSIIKDTFHPGPREVVPTGDGSLGTGNLPACGPSSLAGTPCAGPHGQTLQN